MFKTKLQGTEFDLEPVPKISLVHFQLKEESGILAQGWNGSLVWTTKLVQFEKNDCIVRGHKLKVNHENNEDLKKK